MRLSTLGPDHPEVADSFYDLAELYYYQGKDGQALRRYQRALEIQEKAIEQRQLRADDPSYVRTRDALRDVYLARGDYRRAQRMGSS